MDKKGKILKFDLSSDAIQVRNLMSQYFLNIRIKAISNIMPNRNNSHFTEESMIKSLSSFKNRPILCNYKVDEDDYGAHDSNNIRLDLDSNIMYEDYESNNSEKIVGIIRESDNVELVHEDDLAWIYVNCALYVCYNYRIVKRLLKSRGCKVSVEVEILDSYEDENGIEIITEFELLGITLLGEKILEAVPGASVTIPELQQTENYTKQFNAVKFAYKKLEESVNPNFKNPIKNEHKNEIEFVNKEKNSSENISQENFEKGEVTSMTYIEKRQILESALAEALKNLDRNTYFWVEDLDDEYVYFTIGEDKFRAKYELIEHGANIDIEHREYVIRSWRTYSEEDMKGKKDFKVLDPNSTVGNTEAHINHDDDEAGININLHDNDVPGKFSDDEKKENESKEECAKEDGKECKMSEDEKNGSKEECASEDDKEKESKEECTSKEECSKEECGMPDNKGGDSTGDGKKSVNASEDDSESDSDDDKEKCSKEEDCKMSKEEESKQEESTVKPTIISEDTYTALKNEFTALKKEHDILMSQYKEKVQAEQLRFATDFINTETELTEENSKNVFSVIETAIKAEKFSDIDEVQKFAVQEIATTLYAQMKQTKNENKENSGKNTFSCNIVKEKAKFNIGASESDIQEVKGAVDALNKI